MRPSPTSSSLLSEISKFMLPTALAAALCAWGGVRPRWCLRKGLRRIWLRSWYRVCEQRHGATIGAPFCLATLSPLILCGAVWRVV
jgi:hypothetical protein